MPVCQCQAFWFRARPAEKSALSFLDFVRPQGVESARGEVLGAGSQERLRVIPQIQQNTGGSGMASSYRVISSDNHVYEPPDLWSSRVESKFRDRAPYVVRLEDEGDWWFCDGHKIVGAFAGAQTGRRFEAPEKLSRKDILENVRPGGYL